MCRSCTPSTSGRDSRKARTATTSTAAGAVSIARSSASRSRPQVPNRIATRIAKLTTGSIQAWPVNRIRAPAITTPAEIPASAAMCRKAERTLASCSRPALNSRAVRPLTTTPAAATPIISPVAGRAGCSSRPIASLAMKPQAKISSSALARAASTVALPKP